MKARLVVALCLLLVACRGASSNELYRETTVHAANVEAKMAAWTAAQVWLMRHDFDEGEIRSVDTPRYVKRSRPDEVITLLRDSDSNLVRIRIDVTHGIQPAVLAEYTELGEIATAAAERKP